MAVLGIVYSCIQPVVTLLCLFVFTLFLVAYKFQFIYVFDQPDNNETGGRFFPRGITHIFCGIYLQELVLIGLFFLAADNNSKRSAPAEVCPD